MINVNFLKEYLLWMQIIGPFNFNFPASQCLSLLALFLASLSRLSKILYLPSLV